MKMTRVRETARRIRQWESWPRLKRLTDRLICWLVMIYLAAVAFFETGAVVLGVTGTAVAVAAAFAGLAFAYASLLVEGSAARIQAASSGEHLTYGASLCLFAALFKHGSFAIPKHIALLLGDPTPEVSLLEFARILFLSRHIPTVYGIVGAMFAILSFILFFVGVLFIQRGIRMLSSTTYQRIESRQEHLDYFPSLEDMRLPSEDVDGKQSRATTLPHPPAACERSEGQS
jgi:hypothetical protein